MFKIIEPLPPQKAEVLSNEKINKGSKSPTQQKTKLLVHQGYKSFYVAKYLELKKIYRKSKYNSCKDNSLKRFLNIL